MSQPQSRSRKVAILTLQGFQKLQTAQSKTAIWNHDTKSCTLEALSEQTGLSTHTLSKVHARKASVDLRTLVRYFSAFKLILEPTDYIFSIQNSKTTKVVSASPSNGVRVTASLTPKNTVSWGMAPDVSVFYGCAAELATLQQWILAPQCRLITLLGMGGIGKTWLATKLAERIQSKFESVIWRSLRPITRSHSPISFSYFLNDLISHLTPQPNLAIPEPIGAKVQQLIDILRGIPCLLILDNVESILQGDTPQIASRNDSIEQSHADYEIYAELLQQLGQGRHQSCIVLTSRIEPKPIQHFFGETSGVHSLSIQGLNVLEIQQLLSTKGIFQGTATEWNRLVNYYGGNPLILETVAITIQRLFNGSITDFLRQKTMIFDDIRELLDQQFECLSTPEKEVIRVLANQDTPLSFSQLRSQILPSITTVVMLESMKSLKRRSLIERRIAHSCLQPLLKDYVREGGVSTYSQVISNK